MNAAMANAIIAMILFLICYQNLSNIGGLTGIVFIL